MEESTDFLQLFDPDLSSVIFSRLDDLADIIRVSAVSRSWNEFVIANGFTKKHCQRLFPEISSATRSIEENNMIEPVDAGSDNLKRNHLLYTLLARGLTSTLSYDCILEALCASSTDNYPEEWIHNTLVSNDRIDRRDTYWSSQGESDLEVSEKLTYTLCSDLCVVTEINVHPFQAHFQKNSPIYSAKAVRFRMGHLKVLNLEKEIGHEDMESFKAFDEYVVWTYISPDFPMVQENYLQKFRLPEPVVCIGGILQVELLGRHQIQEADKLFYICVAHVEVVGWPLSSFDVEFVDVSGRCKLKYNNPLEGSVNTSERKKGYGNGRRHFASRLKSPRLMQTDERGFLLLLPDDQ